MDSYKIDISTGEQKTQLIFSHNPTSGLYDMFVNGKYSGSFLFIEDGVQQALGRLSLEE